MMQKQWSRIMLLGLFVMAMAIQAYGFNEAPMLAELVKAGKLPSVDQRLPETPMVVKPLVAPGQYGGQLKWGFVGTSAAWGGLLYIAAWEHLVTWKPDFSGVEPNIAESVEVSPDAKEYTFHLRKGMKWSDGQPYTADDIVFYIEDVLRNPELSPGGFSADWMPADQVEGFQVEKIDDYTLKFTFPKPYGAFLYTLATWNGRQFGQYPKHYLMKFHKKYNETVDELVKADGTVQDWMGLFFKLGPDNWGNPDRWFTMTEMPTLGPWMTKQPLGAGTTITLERNPYYWKVDDQGNQLPYLDTVLGVSYQDDESRTLAMLNGEFDYLKPAGSNRALFHEARDQGKPIYILYPNVDAANTNSLHFNQSIGDPIKAQVFASKDFRIGMSHAINRSEIIDIVFDGQGEPSQVAPLKDSPIYIEGMDTQYTEYDVAKANEYLDKVLPQKGADGMRLGPDGQPFKIIFSVMNNLSFGTQYIQIAELLTGYWKAVGVDVVLNSVADTQFNEQIRRKNLVEATMFTGEGGTFISALMDSRYYVPMDYQGLYGNGWYSWRTKSHLDGITVPAEPPQWAIDARNEFEEVLRLPTTEQQIEQMRKVLATAKENFYVIGLARPAAGYTVVNKRLQGVPDGGYSDWLQGNQKIQRPEQWFIQ